MRNQKDILLVNIGAYSERRRYSWMLREPTMGLYTLKSHLSNCGFQVDILDGCISSVNEHEIIKRALNASVLGFYAVYTNMVGIFRISSIVKQKNKNILILLGGPNSLAAEGILTAGQNIDVIVRDYEENALKAILTNMKEFKSPKLRSVPDVTFRAGEQIVNVPHKKVNRHKLGLISVEFEVPVMKRRIMKLITAKGCPNRCKFCPSPRWEELCSIEDALLVMEAAWKNGIRDFYFADENFFPPKKINRAFMLYELIKNSSVIKEKPRIKLYIEPRTPLYILRQLSKVAYITAFVGFESFSDNTLGFFGKETSREDNLSFWKFACEMKINVLPGIIALHPMLEPNELLDLIDILTIHNSISWRSLLKKLDLYPGTPLLLTMENDFPSLLREDFSPFIRPYSWDYAYDKKREKPVLAKIEKIFADIGTQPEVEDIYDLMFDYSFVNQALNDSGHFDYNYNSIRSYFSRTTRKLAREIVLTFNEDAHKQVDTVMKSLFPPYLKEIDKMRHKLINITEKMLEE